MIIFKLAAWVVASAMLMLFAGMITASLSVSIDSVISPRTHALKLQEWPANPATSCTYRPDWSDQKFSCQPKG